MSNLFDLHAALSWETLAVVLAIAYLLLAMRENILCWYAALASTAIYTLLFWDVGLLMESALNVYYMGMAVFGWYSWRYGGEAHEGVAIKTWHWSTHMVAISAIGFVTMLSGYVLSRTTQAALPYLDSFTTWASVLTTFMVARKVLENWLYWIVIDAVSIYLYIDRGLDQTAALFAAYVVIAVFGWFTWRRHHRQQADVRLETAA